MIFENDFLTSLVGSLKILVRSVQMLYIYAQTDSEEDISIQHPSSCSATVIMESSSADNAGVSITGQEETEAKGSEELEAGPQPQEESNINNPDDLISVSYDARSWTLWRSVLRASLQQFSPILIFDGIVVNSVEF